MRAIILFNPDARYLDPAVSSQVESLREKVYATLERYCRQHNENEVSRFAKLLLRLPALRSIGLKCVEQLFFYKLIKVSKNYFNILALFSNNSIIECNLYYGLFHFRTRGSIFQVMEEMGEMVVIRNTVQ